MVRPIALALAVLSAAPGAAVDRIGVKVLPRHDGDTCRGRKPGDVGAHTDIMVAVRDAFDATERQLKDYARLQSKCRAAMGLGRVKTPWQKH
jgi:hypothetical protein